MRTALRVSSFLLWATFTLTFGAFVGAVAYLTRAVVLYWQWGWHGAERDVWRLQRWLKQETD